MKTGNEEENPELFGLPRGEAGAKMETGAVMTRNR